MTKYKCGCESNGSIIINNKITSFLDYRYWSESVGVFGTKELCIYCWLEKKKIKSGMYCKFKKGKWVKKK